MRHIGKEDYKPDAPQMMSEPTVLYIGTRFTIHAYCLDPDKYGAANPEGTDFVMEDLEWVQMTWEFLRGGTEGSGNPLEDHLLAYDAETGFWHPIDPNVKDRVALDYTMQYSDVAITTSLMLQVDEDPSD